MTSAAPSQEWWSAAELASAGLPDLPSTKQGVALLIKRQSWLTDPERARRRSGRGGGWEYHWTLLPSRAQAMLLQREQAASPAAEPDNRPGRDEAWTWFDALPEKPKSEARRRLEVVQKVEALEAAGSTRNLAVIDAARLSGDGARTIWGWFEMIRGVRSDDRLPYLAPRHRAARRKSRRTEVDPRFGDLIKADYLRLSQPTLMSVYARCVRIAEAEGIPTVPIHTIRRWIERNVSETALVLGRKGMEALKRMRPAQERDKSALHALEAVNGDFHRFDVFVRFPAGPGGQKEEIIRPQMVAFQDVYSGRIVAWGVDRTPNSTAVQLCIGAMIERWGIPYHVVLDNGREFAAKLITGGARSRFRFRVREDDMSGLLTSLGCEIHWAKPYSGQSKPIERAFRDMCDTVAKHPAFEGAYTGNRPDAKPENYGSRAIPLDQFLAVLAEEIELHNARPDRRSEVANGRSFTEVFDESYAAAPIRKATAEQRRLWLMGAEGIRAQSRTGRVRFMGNSYWAEWMHEIAGRKIVARFDRAALWDGLHVYSMENAYLGYAPCIAKAGFFDVDDARAHARSLKEWQTARRAELAAHRKLTAGDVADALAAAPKTAAQPVEAKIIRPLFDAPRPPQPQAPRPEVEAARQAIIADLASRRPAPPPTDDGRQTYARALEIERRLEGGQTVTKEQRKWLEGYRTTPEYRTWKAMVADFGEDILAG
ncbi:transposase domain-containing protein [Limimaricola variabilis]|uniref:transposase domain-containing protein n=1 Tax=Limimaricola variabilis TaxID=1492771 RepID=UPI002AC8F79D|nr:transposase domain-containing protein [Limimaricola variabilis]WPY94705.1 transposase domain-containing protein [Limimaricola variabilis]